MAASRNIASARNMDAVAVFVGGTSGIGQGMAEAFNRRTKGNGHIVLVGRNREAAESVISKMKSVAEESSTGTYEFVPCDVSLISNVKRSAASIVTKHPKINFLVITAGVMLGSNTPTEEGIGKVAAVHYYGRWSFIRELLPALRSARDANEDSKVMSVYAAARGSGADTLATNNDMMCEEYALRNPGIVFAHSAPGAVRTNLLKASESIVLRTMNIILPLLRPFTVSQDECGESLWSGLYRCVAGAGSGSVTGAYRIGPKGQDLGLAEYFGSPEQRKALWEHTTKITNSVDDA